MSAPRLLAPREERDHHEMGSVDELIRYGGVTTRGEGVVIGKHRGEILRVPGDRHMMILGPTRSGKGAGLIVPTLLKHPGSMLVFDPKNELAQITGRHRAGRGPCYHFSATDRYSDHFNPLLEIRTDDHMVGDCQIVADLLVHPSNSDEGSSSEDYWNPAAKNIITALLVQVLASSRPTLAHLYELAMDLQRGRHPKYVDIATERVLDGLRNEEERVRDSKTSTVVAKLEWLIDPLIQETTSRSDFRASDLMANDDPVTVYLSVPVADSARLRPLTRLVLQALLKPLLHDLTLCADGRPKRHPLLVMIDECPQLGHMDVLENGLPVLAGYGVRACLAAQDIDQLIAIYGEHEAITANCGTVCLFPGYSKSSLRVIEEWGGWSVEPMRSRGRDTSRPLAVHWSENEQRVPLLNPREMLAERDRVLVFRLGCRPTYVNRLRYFEEECLAGRWDLI